MQKTCNKCKKIKQLIDFHVDKRNKDGRHTLCKLCCKKKKDENRRKNEKSSTMQFNKVCCTCEIEKPCIDFYKDKSMIDGYKYACKECTKPKRKIQHRKYYDNNSEKIIQSQIKYQKDNPEIIRAKNAKRRAVKLQATVNWSNKEKINNFYINARQLELKDGVKRHVDHIIPLQGENVSGLHVETNLQILTAEENHKKYNKF